MLRLAKRFSSVTGVNFSHRPHECVARCCYRYGEDLIVEGKEINGPCPRDDPDDDRNPQLPFSPPLEQFYLTDAERIMTPVREVLRA